MMFTSYRHWSVLNKEVNIYANFLSWAEILCPLTMLWFNFQIGLIF